MLNGECNRNSKLYRANLITGIETSYRLQAYNFRFGAMWCELPKGKFCITGGQNGFLSSKQVVSIDFIRDFAIVDKPQMLSARSYHGSVCHAGCVYVVGGSAKFMKGNLSFAKCERFIGERWEKLQPLPLAAASGNLITLKNYLYIFGGYNNLSESDTLQRLCLRTLTWEVMTLRLPFPGSSIACFKLDESQVYFIIDQGLYAYSPDFSKITHIKGLDMSIESRQGLSYYSQGILYCSNDRDALQRLEIGMLT